MGVIHESNEKAGRMWWTMDTLWTMDTKMQAVSSVLLGDLDSLLQNKPLLTLSRETIDQRDHFEDTAWVTVTISNRNINHRL